MKKRETTITIRCSKQLRKEFIEKVNEGKN